MIATSTQSPQKFRPIDLTIKIETEEELRALQKLAQANATVPNAIYTSSGDSEQKDLLSEVLESIHDALKAC